MATKTDTDLIEIYELLDSLTDLPRYSAEDRLAIQRAKDLLATKLK